MQAQQLALQVLHCACALLDLLHRVQHLRARSVSTPGARDWQRWPRTRRDAHLAAALLSDGLLPDLLAFARLNHLVDLLLVGLRSAEPGP